MKADGLKSLTTAELEANCKLKKWEKAISSYGCGTHLFVSILIVAGIGFVLNGFETRTFWFAYVFLVIFVWLYSMYFFDWLSRIRTRCYRNELKRRIQWDGYDGSRRPEFSKIGNPLIADWVVRYEITEYQEDESTSYFFCLYLKNDSDLKGLIVYIARPSHGKFHPLIGEEIIISTEVSSSEITLAQDECNEFLEILKSVPLSEFKGLGFGGMGCYDGPTSSLSIRNNKIDSSIGPLREDGFHPCPEKGPSLNLMYLIFKLLNKKKVEGLEKFNSDYFEILERDKKWNEHLDGWIKKRRMRRKIQN